MKTVIIGNGILSISTALRLAQRAKSGDSITIIGKKARPGSATLAAAAMLNSFCEVEEGSLESELELYRFELSQRAARAWPTFLKTIFDLGGSRSRGFSACDGTPGGLYDVGTYVIDNTAADHLDDVNFDAIVTALKRFNEPYREVNPRGIPNYAPAERMRATRAIYIEREGWMNPRLTMEAIDTALSSFSCVRFVDAEVESIVRTGDSVDHVVLKEGERIEGDSFLLATGATSSEILGNSNLDLNIQRIFYGVGVSVEIKSPEFPHTKCIRTPNRGLACGLYTVPYFHDPKEPLDSIIIGASSLVSPWPMEGGRITSVSSLLKGVMDQVNHNLYRATFTRVNVGFRPTSSDTFPVLGKTSIRNFFVATGTKRDGFHLCPTLSEILASIICGEQVDKRFEWFRPERPLIRALTREQAIEKGVKHQISGAYQHGFTPAHSRMPEQIKRMYRDDLERLHDKVGATDWGIPPDLIDMYRYGHIGGGRMTTETNIIELDEPLNEIAVPEAAASSLSSRLP